MGGRKDKKKDAKEDDTDKEKSDEKKKSKKDDEDGKGKGKKDKKKDAKEDDTDKEKTDDKKKDDKDGKEDDAGKDKKGKEGSKKGSLFASCDGKGLDFAAGSGGCGWGDGDEQLEVFIDVGHTLHELKPGCSEANPNTPTNPLYGEPRFALPSARAGEVICCNAS